MQEGLSGGWINAVILGVVEGLTEFLPVSSTGHLIVVAHWLGETSKEAKLFEIVIQMGAMVAICWHYRWRLWDMLRHLPNPASPAFALMLQLIVAFIPAAVLGLLFHGAIKKYLFSPGTVAVALMLGGVVIIVVERRRHSPRVSGLEGMRFSDAFIIGLAQSLALFPGVSRAGATIIGGILRGLDRKTATEFSFLLALPTLFAASVFDLWQNADLLNLAFAGEILCGFTVAFVSALVTVRWLLHYVTRYKFTVFGWYRLIFGAIVLFVFYYARP